MQKSIKFNEVFTGPATNNNTHDSDYIAFIFHGYGADYNDLVSLADALNVENKSIHWVFPNGPFEVPIGPGWTGRAWWPLTLSSLPHDWSDITPPGIDDLKTNLKSFIESFKVPYEKVIFGGFSQGAMLATELYLSAPTTPKGLLSFSGTLIRKSKWESACENRRHQKVFLSHGEQDQVLPSSGTHKLIQLFKKYDINCDFSSFQGGHEIPPKALLKAQNYLKSVL